MGRRGDARCRRSKTWRSGLLARLARTAEHRLAVAVDVGDHDVAVDCLQGALDFFQWSKHSGHAAVVVHCHLGHAAAASADGFEGVCKGEGASSYQRSVFAQAVSHGEIWLDAVSGEEADRKEVGCQYGWLSNRGLAQIVFGPGHCGGISLVDEDEFAERLAQQGRHHAISFSKSFGDNRLRLPE